MEGAAEGAEAPLRLGGVLRSLGGVERGRQALEKAAELAATPRMTAEAHTVLADLARRGVPRRKIEVRSNATLDQRAVRSQGPVAGDVSEPLDDYDGPVNGNRARGRGAEARGRPGGPSKERLRGRSRPDSPGTWW